MQTTALTRTTLVHELTSVLGDVMTAGYALTDEVKAANVTRLENLFEPLEALDTSGMRGAAAAYEGLGAAYDGLNNLGAYGMPDFAPFVDGIGSALKGALDLA